MKLKSITVRDKREAPAQYNVPSMSKEQHEEHRRHRGVIRGIEGRVICAYGYKGYRLFISIFTLTPYICHNLVRSAQRKARYCNSLQI